MTVRTSTALIFSSLLLLLAGCASGIHGRVLLVDNQQNPIPGVNSKGAVINMINVGAALDRASASAVTDERGNFIAPKDSVKPGKYKVEASHIGYITQTQEIEVGSWWNKEVEFKLQKIQEGRRAAVKGTLTDEDKIVNPGEVNIQPPVM